MKNAQTYFKNLAVYTTSFLKYVWLFFLSMHEMVKVCSETSPSLHRPES